MKCINNNYDNNNWGRKTNEKERIEVWIKNVRFTQHIIIR